MGGDKAPREIVVGAMRAAPDIDGEILLVGDEAQLKSLIDPQVKNVRIIHASEWIGMEEKPLDAYRKKKDSSLRVGANLVKEGEADVLVSAGNTGAAVATCQLTWRQFPGIHRPAIVSVMPGIEQPFYVLDTGASPDVDPQHLLEFALMGRAFAKAAGRKNPGVHLLNIGEEEGKGNALAKETYKLLERFDWFKGNIEGKEVFISPIDVVLCEAFVGNIFLKTGEGVVEAILRMVRSRLPKGKLARLPYWGVGKVLRPVFHKLDWAEVGGSPLLGLNGLCVIAHGRSDARAMRNCLLMAQQSVKNDLLGEIRRSVAETLG